MNEYCYSCCSCYWHARFLPPWRVCYSTAVGVEGGEEIACGSVESYGVYSVLYTCGLLLRVGLPCGPLLECVYLHRFLRVRKRTTRYLRCFSCFQKAFFRAGPILWFLHYYLHLLTAPARCVYLFFAHQEPKSMVFTVCWLVFRKRFFHQVI